MYFHLGKACGLEELVKVQCAWVQDLQIQFSDLEVLTFQPSEAHMWQNATYLGAFVGTGLQPKQ